MLKAEDFVEASVLIRLMEKRVLNKAGIERIMDAPSAIEVLRLLTQDSTHNFGELRNAEDYEKVLAASLKELYQTLYRLSKHPVVIDIPALKYVFHNMKVAVKDAVGTNKGSEELYFDFTTIDPDDIASYAMNGKIEEREDNDGNEYSVLNEFNKKKEDNKNNVLPPFVCEAVDEAKEKFRETGNPEDIDIVLDKRMYQQMLSYCKSVNSEFITNYVKHSIDFYNIKAFMRVKNIGKGLSFLQECLIPDGLTDVSSFLANFDKPYEALSQVFYYKYYFGNTIQTGMSAYERSGNFSGLEKLFDNGLIELVKQSKYIAYGPEILFAYILSKENEIRQIRIVVACKLNNMSVESIRERLRDNYA